MSGSNPRHIAIIMDGNGRWAKKRFLPRYAGHKSGLQATRTVIQYCVDHSIEALTLFAFSSENWRRPKTEVGMLMDLFLTALRKEIKNLHENNVRMQFIGDISAFGNKLQNEISESEALTRDNTGLLLSIAVNYGGRWDITEAMRRIAAKIVEGDIQPGQINEEMVAQHLCLAQLPEPDLFIRTGGEQRISNFLLWQLAYTELYFTDTLWPDFSDACLQEALESFANRQRRFGQTGDQIEKSPENA
jgi:undecaprenyl diphosphate synthase